MNDIIKKDAKRVGIYLLAFVKWVAVAALTGAIGGLVGVAFHVSVEKVTEFRQIHEWIIYLLPVGGLVIAGLYKLCKLENTGTDRVIDSIRTDEGVPTLLAPLIFVSTVITHLLGGSAGREGAALQLGGSIGSKIGKLLHFDEKDKHLVILCGMSAVFSALFGTPITAALFALEVISVGVVYYSGIIPCLVSGLVSYWISMLFKVEPVRFALKNQPEYNFMDFMKVALLAAVCAGLSIVFCLVMHFFHKGAAKLFKNTFLRAVVGGVLIILLTLIFGRDYNGAGMNIIENAIIGGHAVGYAFLLKMLFTAVTIGSGYKGGEIVPTFFIGATFGCFFGGLLGLDPGFAAAIGLVSLFCGVVNCPIASIFLSIELFSSTSLIYFAVACAISYTLSGYFGLYGSQKIMYSKIRAEFININTWQEIK
ncbi:MAG: chloride channel protein [Faecalibacterium sp.]|nr:chloride channel protein [Ruminococcus sp.]MCM1392867.1 chloride channel protein [Ruminococcus sp.]MCM1485843.1 chloride channel protein [Faecalibacterium sp.]